MGKELADRSYRGGVMSNVKSVGQVLDENRGLGPGFDFMRVALAFSVVAWHVAPLATNDWSQDHTRFLWLFDYSILELFFSLSGFLIAGSAIRLSLKNFMINRSLRIFPALIIEILLSAFIIGPLMTNLPIKDYFSSGVTWHYFTNIFGWINYNLPGVFTHNPTRMVNASLWTVPFEIGCYILMGIWMQFSLLKKPWTLFILAGVVLAVGLTMRAAHYSGTPTGVWVTAIDQIFWNRGSRLFTAFALGIAAYAYRYRLPYSWKIFSACVTYYVVVALIGHRQYTVPVIDAATCLPLTYIMVFLGLTKLPKLPFFHRGDYSYGIYLYGWPIMQVMRTVFPDLGRTFAGLLLISVVPITLFAIFSWHFIEKPILKMRKNFSFVARQRLAESEPTPPHARADTAPQLAVQSPS